VYSFLGMDFFPAGCFARGDEESGVAPALRRNFSTPPECRTCLARDHREAFCSRAKFPLSRVRILEGEVPPEPRAYLGRAKFHLSRVRIWEGEVPPEPRAYLGGRSST
jgi:hypothetical protein